MQNVLTDIPTTLRDKVKPKHAVLAVTVVVVAAAALSGLHVVKLTNDIKALTTNLDAQTVSLVTTKKLLAEQVAAATHAKSVADASLASALTDSATLKSSVEAFARQAASCEQIKRQLKVGE